MENFKEFQGSDLDECIQQAMEWFNSKREMLEVEIIQDAKTGIFGIVGARKAKIKARKAQMVETMRNILEDNTEKKAENLPIIAKQDTHSAGTQAKQAEVKRTSKKTFVNRNWSQKGDRHPQKGYRPAVKNPSPCVDKGSGKEQSGDNLKKNFSIIANKKDKQINERWNQNLKETDHHLENDAGENSPWPDIPVLELNQDKLKEKTLEVVKQLIFPLAEKEIGLHFDLSQGYPRVKVDWEGDAGILIGRDGNTLVAVQYLASRILSKIMEASLRVRLDIGDYRAKQSERLRDLAIGLAKKARHTGKSYSTRPLTSYHRRVIHIALHDVSDIQTRSAGEGPLKRVIISPKRV